MPNLILTTSRHWLASMRCHIGICVTGSILIGCSVATDPTSSLPGTYVTVSISGKPLPAVLDSSVAGAIVLLGDTLTLRNDGQFLESMVIERNGVMDVTDLSGRWLVEGQMISLQTADEQYRHELQVDGTNGLTTLARHYQPATDVLRIFRYSKQD